jgi:hypothetical protein
MYQPHAFFLLPNNACCSFFCMVSPSPPRENDFQEAGCTPSFHRRLDVALPIVFSWTFEDAGRISGGDNEFFGSKGEIDETRLADDP